MSLLILGSSTSLLAQRQRPRAFEKNASPTQQVSESNAASKTTTHEEYPESELGFSWNTSTSAWDSSTQSTITYFPNGGQNVVLFSYYNNGIFTPSGRSTIWQDAAGRDTSSLYEYYNGTIWINSSRSTTAYDANGNSNLWWYYNWGGSSWDVNSAYRSTYTYVNGNDISLQIDEYYDPLLQTWANDYKVEFAYNVQNQWNSYTSYNWNMNAWEPDEKFKDVIWYNYTKFQPLSGTIQGFTTQWEDLQRLSVNYTGGQETWLYEEKVGPSWVNASREIYRYDIYEHQTFAESATWDSTNSWAMTYLDSALYLYNGFGQTMEVINLDYDSTGFHNFYRRVYGDFFTGSNPAQVLDLKMAVYPNPAAEVLHFQLSLAKPSAVSIILYDLQGRKRVETTTTANGQEIVVPIAASLEQGTYIYRVQTKEGHAEGKVMIAR